MSDNNLSPEEIATALCCVLSRGYEGCPCVPCRARDLLRSQAHRIAELERLLRIATGAAIEMAALNEAQSRYAQECEEQQKAAYARENELAQQVDDLRAELDRAVAKQREIYSNARQLDAFQTDASADG